MGRKLYLDSVIIGNTIFFYGFYMRVSLDGELKSEFVYSLDYVAVPLLLKLRLLSVISEQDRLTPEVRSNILLLLLKDMLVLWLIVARDDFLR